MTKSVQVYSSKGVSQSRDGATVRRSDYKLSVINSGRIQIKLKFEYSKVLQKIEYLQNQLDVRSIHFQIFFQLVIFVPREVLNLLFSHFDSVIELNN